MRCRILCLMFLYFMGESYGQLRCIMVTPSVLHVDTEETIMVSTEGQPSSSIEIKVHNFSDRKLLAESKMYLNKDNQLGKAAIKISSKHFQKTVKNKKQFVTIQAKAAACSLEKHVLLSFHSGYIFIQTDKPIYTPGSKLLYRIFPVNYKLQPANAPVYVDLQNPEGIIVQHDFIQSDPDGFISKSNDLPELASLGTWTLIVKYDGLLENFTTNFEVKEYVLPSFEVTIKPEQNFMYLDDATFSVTINAQYIYGKPVSGKAFVLFKVMKGNEEKSITDSLRRIQISDGTGDVILLRRDLIKGFRYPDDLLQYKLHISATVITESGGDLVEATLGNIFIVKSPYKILFTRTPKYFKPGMPFDLSVMVTNPDGSPAKNIPVVAQPGSVTAMTLEDGTARIILNTGTNTSTLNLNVKTVVPRLQSTRQASGRLSLQAYKASNGQPNYLHISVSSDLLERGKQVFITFNILNRNVETQEKILQFTYLILSRGRIVKVGKQERVTGQFMVAMPLVITEDLLPSFRIVAYYTIGDEIVSDSLWVDVVDDCLGTLELKASKTKAEPGDPISITLRADHNSSVGLVAVDKAVYALNNKYKMTQSKVWNTVEKSDTGCSPGSGANNMGVFYDAGLAVQTNFGLSTEQRSDSFCDAGKKRRRRSSADLKEFKSIKASNYTDLERQCCHDGMVHNAMDHSCERRARLIQEGDKCVKAFLDCCRSIELKRQIDKKMKDDGLDKSYSDDEYLEDDKITVRSDFPESWLWDVVKMKKAPNADGISTEVLQRKFLRDSITTWEVLAISLSPQKGICVAQPYEIQAVKNFFIDLKLPYSVARNEQVEIRAIIYNYEDKDLKVRVSFSHNPDFCSLSTQTKKYTKEVTVKEHSSFAVPFVIVPLTVGKLSVEVKAAIYGEFGGDGVRKLLNVVPEGNRKAVTLKSLILDPGAKGKSGEHIVTIPTFIPKNKVPGSEIIIKIIIQASPISQLVENAINGSNISHLILMPLGCAEQRMQKMTAVVIATYYLDKTNQWDKIGLRRREEALGYIRSEYANQLHYRKLDGSYGSFRNSVPSTWVTAYVSKVFAMASGLADIVGGDILCGSIKWLILNQQKPDGLFQENTPISAQYTSGGLYRSKDPDVAITAFVVISLLESQKICGSQVDNLNTSISKAVEFLQVHYQPLVRPHSVAITSYALALAGKLQNPNKLLSAATDKSHWNEPGSQDISLEATSYALLALLHLKKYDLVDPVVHWLTEQRFYGSPDRSTQATIMLFQALAQYQVVMADHGKALEVSFKLPERTNTKKYQFNAGNALHARSDETKINKGFDMKAEGQGQAILTVTAVYYEIVTAKEKECNNFNLSVTVMDEPYVKRPEGALGTVSITMCFRHLKPVDATMSILDISMMTGFYPDIEDLKRLKKGVDRYISDFEINKGEFDKGTLIIYLDKVSHTEEECLKFNAHQDFNVGLIQPASVTIYDYYTPESRCTKFYHRDEGDKSLGTLCQGDVCRCAEGNCLMAQQTGGSFTAVDRIRKACEAKMDYAFKATLLETQYEKDYDRYVMNVKDVFKMGTDESARGNRRNFISHIKCRNTLKLKEGLDYLMFGKSKDIWLTDAISYSYVIGNDTWIEWWPNDRQCQEPEHQHLCDIFHQVAEELVAFGCNA